MGRWSRPLRCVIGLSVLVAALPGCGRDYCIAEGTLVLMPDGPRPVEQLQLGDPVLSQGGALGRVTGIAHSKTDSLMVLRLEDGRELRATAEHPVWTSHGWYAACELHAGARLMTPGGDAHLQDVAVEQRSARVYDISVEPGRTYFAGGILVHNKTVPRMPTREQIVGNWVGQDRSGVVVVALRADSTGAYATDSWNGASARQISHWEVDTRQYPHRMLLTVEPGGQSAHTVPVKVTAVFGSTTSFALQWPGGEPFDLLPEQLHREQTGRLLEAIRGFHDAQVEE